MMYNKKIGWLQRVGKVVVMSIFKHNRSNLSYCFGVVITGVQVKGSHFPANNETLWDEHTNTLDLMSYFQEAESQTDRWGRQM